jgi:hypothetical protein
MRVSTIRASAAPRLAVALVCAAVALAAPRPAAAQYYAPPLTDAAMGEQYHVELSGTLWNPAFFGTVSSEQFGRIGTDLDFETDLGFEQTRFKDVRIVLRPARKHRFRLQYTPIVYTADTVLNRTVVFNNIEFPAALPVSTEFDWKVWRLGYEYDVFYRSRGFVGVFAEARYTQFVASLAGLGRSEFTSAKAPLPALGVAARGYVTRNVALNFEMSGFKLPDVDPEYQANYYDWNISGTANLTNNLGIEVGWRKMTTFLEIERDQGDFAFKGMWFGATVRY